mmetsp:Transcript_18283/g.39715  ORF Transcript_18283/g.39715 Transcript_18283/m.39715 type:complete len:94 (-) Transcript_18283:15-296(-)
MPDVISTARRAPLFIPPRHTTPLSENHSVPTTLVFDILTVLLKLFSPTPDPTTVTDPAPVAAEFTLITELTAPSTLMTELIVPAPTCEVMTTL